MKTKLLTLILLSFVIVTTTSFANYNRSQTQSSAAKPAADNLIITPGVSAGAITARTSLQDLLRLYGKAQVKEQPIGVGEGFTEPGAVIFPKDPTKTAEIIWKDKKLKRTPELVRISSAKSLWQTTQGIKIGTTLREVEQLNGKPFKLSGFDWDYGGTLTSYEKGKLAAMQGKLLLRFDYKKGKATEQELLSVAGDTEFSSANRVMQKLNPYVAQIICRF